MEDGAPDAEGEALLAELMRAFGLVEADLVRASYVDLLCDEESAPPVGT